MAYDHKAEYAQHLRRIARDLFVFRGRSQRTELVLFFIIIMLVDVVASMTVSERLWQLEFAVALLMMPLLARRLHDFNRSGWFSVIVPAIAGMNAWAYWQFDAGTLPIPELDFPYSFARGLLVLAFWVIVVWPGTKGANRFGPDPRTGEASPST